ncbi:hypothetical protein MKY87_01045 [Paenibacillus sp. FSL R7-0198]|uniref:hypothetical protein n=1 Tax=unclassified Paenibacillus TaxID=185978 RepID=UPI0030D8A7B4
MKMTTQQYAEIIAGKVAHTAKNIAKNSGRKEEADSDVAAAMIVTFAEEMMEVIRKRTPNTPNPLSKTFVKLKRFLRGVG